MNGKTTLAKRDSADTSSFVEDAREQAGSGMGSAPLFQHARRPYERPFKKAERETTTVLFGGLTRRHDELVGSAMKALGYTARPVPPVTRADFHTGREYCDNGLCNPAYFTVGALVNYLKSLRDEGGMSVSEIIDRFVYVTVGSCGPCRFGTYEAQFRLALRNSGFEGFRVLLFHQMGGLRGSDGDDGLELTARFAAGLLNPMMMADLLNELAWQIRPYEVHPGQTSEVFREIDARMCEAVARKPMPPFRRTPKLLRPLLFGCDLDQAAVILDQVLGDHYVRALASCRELVDTVEVDYTRPKPVCRITGEFWAQRTEGAGNFHMFEFLESQGAEVLVEPVMTWAFYLLHTARRRLDWHTPLSCGLSPWTRIRNAAVRVRTRTLLRGAEWLLHREYERARRALGGTTLPQPSQDDLEIHAAPFYDARIQGGEGHLEVGETILFSQKGLAHMFLGLKPFGCLPSTQSDGVQGAVARAYPEVIYVPIETGGEGEVDAHSRVQLVLEEAHDRCRAEFQQCLARAGLTTEQLREYVRSHPELRRPLSPPPPAEGVVGKAARLALHIGERTGSLCRQEGGES